MLVISAKNSTPVVSSLGASSSFVGIAEDVTQYSSIRVALRGDSFAPGTLYVGFSTDGIAWTETAHLVSDPATFTPLVVKVTNLYFRARYVNGATPLAFFRLQSLLNTGDAVAGGGGGGGGGSVTQVRQLVTLTSGNISTKSFAIASAPLNPAALSLFPQGGPKQRYGIDFSVTGTTVSWGGMGLDGFLEAGEAVEVVYLT